MYWKKKKLKYEILVPTILKPFEDFTEQETQEYFDWYISKIPERIQILAAYSGVILDYSPESLVDIWTWFIKNVEIEKTPKVRIEELKKQLQGQPKDYMDSVLKENEQQLSLESMYILRDIAMYIGEVDVRNNNALYWGFHTDVHLDSFANRPIIMGYEDRDYTPPFKFHSDPLFFAQCCAEGILVKQTYPTELLEGYQKMQKNVHNL